MISPEDGNKQKFEDKPALSPTEEKQVPSVVKKKRPWIEPLLRGVAIVVSLIMGFACVSLVVFSSLPTIENPPSYRLVFLGTVALLLMVLVGVGCAVLFRSWWATLFVPVAFVLGAYVASYLLPLLIPITDEYKNEEVYGGVEILLYFIPSLVVISAFSGSYFGMLWKKREHITPSLPQPGVPLLQHMLAILILVVGGFAISMFALFGTRPDIWATPILAVVLLAFVCARL
ncbi:MAG TPA: hypothetical protein VEI53_10990, partial [Ktedonobacteraceae bacterium]|nr:hypothetical protein [Ktedonobacteraceae bacterium]